MKNDAKVRVSVAMSAVAAVAVVGLVVLELVTTPTVELVSAVGAIGLGAVIVVAWLTGMRSKDLPVETRTGPDVGARLDTAEPISPAEAIGDRD